MESNQQKGIALITKEELSFVPDNSLNANQLKFILTKTPKNYIKEKTGKGGRFKYVTGGYMKKCLNLMFGFDWDFEVVSSEVHGNQQIVVLGKLTCRTNGRQIIKTQFGGADIKFKTQVRTVDGEQKRVRTDEYLDIANDFKAAATDALKKCASEIGIAADVYNADEFKEVNVAPEIDLFDLIELFDLKKDSLSEDMKTHAKRIIDNKEKRSYQKLHKTLSSI